VRRIARLIAPAFGLLAALVAGCASGPERELPSTPPSAGEQAGQAPRAREPAVERDGPPARPVNFARIADAVPKAEPPSPYGNPRSYVVDGRRYFTRTSSRGYVERGVASWYGTKFHGRRTSSGEPYDLYAMTAAHRTLPLPSYVRVTNLENRRQVIVRVNDRGPFHSNRLIDLSYAAAGKLGILPKGTGYVEVEAIDTGAPPEPARALRVEGPQVLYLQLGAFSERENAERVAAKAGHLAGAAVRVSPLERSGRTLYRVRLGPLEGEEEADRLFFRLVAAGLGEPYVVLD